MTKKRYFALYCEGYIYPVFFDSEKNNKEMEAEEVEKLLNELSDENEQLKSENEQLRNELNDNECEWLRNNTVWEQMPSSKRTMIVTKSTSIENNGGKMTEFIIYKISAYQENGFASTQKTIGFYRNKEEARKKVEKLNKIDKNWLYSLHEVEVH